jgi:hypothetical protein
MKHELRCKDCGKYIASKLQWHQCKIQAVIVDTDGNELGRGCSNIFKSSVTRASDNAGLSHNRRGTEKAESYRIVNVLITMDNKNRKNIDDKFDYSLMFDAKTKKSASDICNEADKSFMKSLTSIRRKLELARKELIKKQQVE